MSVHFLGNYTSLEDVWKLFPNGGGFGDYIYLNGVRVDWDEYNNCWGDDDNIGGEVRPAEVLDGSMHVKGNLKVDDGVEVGEYIPGQSGAAMDDHGNAEVRTLSVDALYVNEGGTPVSLADFIKRFKTELPPDWGEYSQITLFDDARVLVFNPSSNEKYYTTIGALKNLIADNIASSFTGDGGGGTIQVIRSDAVDPIYTDNNVMSALKTLAEINKVTGELNLDDKYLSKVNEDTAAEVITFLKGIIASDESSFTDLVASGSITANDVKALNSAETSILRVLTQATLQDVILKGQINSETFTSGFLGSGFRLNKVNDRWVLELDDLIVRKTMQVYELVVQRVKYQGGIIVVGPAGGKITNVTDGGSYWKCEHDSPEDFDTDDQVFCQVTRVGSRAQNPDGSTTFGGLRTKRYWRKVTSFGPGWFNLSKSDMEDGSDVPEVGDEVATFGNRTNTERQSAYMIVAVGQNSPYTAYYSGINSFSLDGKEVTREGNLAGIYDSKFGQLSGYGLYANNVYLRGILRVLSGKTVEEHVQDEIDEVQSHMPRVSDTTNNWEVWTCVEGVWQYVDTGKTSIGDDGRAPMVGTDGYWYEWDGTKYVKTSYKAQGRDGLDGIDFHVSRETIPVQCNSFGTPLSFANTGLKVKLSRGSYDLLYTGYGASDVPSGGDYSITASVDGVSGFTLPSGYQSEVNIGNISGLTKDVGTVTLTFTIYDFRSNSTYQVQRVITFSKVKAGQDGQPGSQGPPGKMPIKREWVQGETHRNNDEVVDYIYYRGVEGGTHYDTWWRLKDGKTSNTAPASPDSNYVQLSQFDMLAVQILIAEEANVAEFIFKEGMLLSQRGRYPNGTYEDYGVSPDQVTNGWVPMIRINAKTGAATWGAGSLAFDENGNITANGLTANKVITPFTRINSLSEFQTKVGSEHNVFFAESSGGVDFEWKTLYLPGDSSLDGLSVKIFAPEGFKNRVLIKPYGTGLIHDATTGRTMQEIRVATGVIDYIYMTAFKNVFKGNRLEWVLQSRYQNYFSSRAVYLKPVLSAGDVLASGAYNGTVNFKENNFDKNVTITWDSTSKVYNILVPALLHYKENGTAQWEHFGAGDVCIDVIPYDLSASVIPVVSSAYYNPGSTTFTFKVKFNGSASGQEAFGFKITALREIIMSKYLRKV